MSFAPVWHCHKMQETKIPERSFSFTRMGAYSKLHNVTYSEIKRHFPRYTIRENIRPDWLLSSKNTKLELDLYIEEINTAIEIQGIQHYEFTPHFHKTYDAFREQQRRDEEKRDLCRGHGVRLIEIAMYLDLKIFIKELLIDKEPDIMQMPIRESKRSAMRHKTVRKRVKLNRRKKFLKLPGSWKQRRYARSTLQSKWEDSEHLLVWGGRETHELAYHGVNDYSCDCTWFTVEGKICSHVIRVMMDEGTFPERKLVRV